MYIEGINPKLTYVASLEAPIPFVVGTRGMDELGREYVFASTTAALTLGDVVLLPLGNSGSAVALTTTAAVGGYNRQVGVAVATFAAAAAGTGFWAQTLGAGNARAATAALVAIPMYTSATAGALDDTAAANNLVRGVTFTTAPSGAGVFPAILNNPTIGTIADTDNNT
jgi:hypothetical protein